jgi:hypothetical protein
MVFTAGTTIRTAGRDWAYLTWQTTTPTLLRGHAFAIYAKAGNAASENPYERKSIVTPQTDARVILPLLNRSINVGGNLLALSNSLQGMFEQLMPPGTLRLEDRVSAVIRGASNDAEHYDNLILLSRLHPGISFCLGLAHAEQIPLGATVTFEVRDFDLARNQDNAVIGRVTMTGGSPPSLSAPGRPFPVPEYPRPASAKGDLNVKLRWANPPELRALGLLHYGFNLYRMNAAFAEARGLDARSPTSDELLTLLGSNPNDVQRVNRLPILADKDFDPNFGDSFFVENLDPLSGDPTTFFAHDDNHRFETGVPFVNGQQVYYFVTAREILGRDGAVSPGRKVTICDRLPPPVPRQVKVENYYRSDGVTVTRGLLVRWRQNDNSGIEQTAAYYVYRWTSIKEMHTSAGNEVINRIGVVNHFDGKTTNAWLDTGVVAPADLGKTYWYSVRAIDKGACGANVSGNSAPAFGVLRDRGGPGGSSGSVQITCDCPTNIWIKNLSTSAAGQRTNLHYYRLVNERRHPGVAWAEFYVQVGAVGSFITRRYFAAGETNLSVDYTIPRPLGSTNVSVLCRVGSANDKTSAVVVVSSVPQPQVSNVVSVCFQSGITTVTSVPGGPCGDHEPFGLGGLVGARLRPLCLSLDPPAGSKQCKFYRRIDDGPLTLINVTNVATPPAAIVVKDGNLPAVASTICYYSQCFDEHGNPGPLVRLDCTDTAGTTPLPRPMLAPIEAVGNAVNPQMRIRWFCPPYGVERFRITINVDGAGLPASFPTTATPMLSPPLVPGGVELRLRVSGIDGPLRAFQFHTPRVGPAFASGPEFELTASVEPARTYFVSIEAVDKTGATAEPPKRSNVQQFTWTTPIVLAGAQQVPWPARPLPGVTAGFVEPVEGRALEARRLRLPYFDGVGVRIGDFYCASCTNTMHPFPTADRDDPMTDLYRNRDGVRSVFPVVLYRYQVPSLKFPSVAGDLVQVSPMMERIAYQLPPLPAPAFVSDPFVIVMAENGGVGTQASPLKGIYLLDTQPVVKSAKYRYLLVRFRDTAGSAPGEGVGEIDTVIPTNEVEVMP